MARRTLTYSWLPFRDLLGEPDFLAMLHAHWVEAEPHKDSFPLDPDFQRYVELDDSGLYRCWVARDGDVLAGYLTLFVQPNLHYRTKLHATGDFYMLLPRYRGHFAAMLRACEGALRELGVARFTIGDRPATSLAPIYERLGFSVIDQTYVKLLT